MGHIRWSGILSVAIGKGIILLRPISVDAFCHGDTKQGLKKALALSQKSANNGGYEAFYRHAITAYPIEMELEEINPVAVNLRSLDWHLKAAQGGHPSSLFRIQALCLESKLFV